MVPSQSPSGDTQAASPEVGVVLLGSGIPASASQPSERFWCSPPGIHNLNSVQTPGTKCCFQYILWLPFENGRHNDPGFYDNRNAASLVVTRNAPPSPPFLSLRARILHPCFHPGKHNHYLRNCHHYESRAFLFLFDL